MIRVAVQRKEWGMLRRLFYVVMIAVGAAVLAVLNGWIESSSAETGPGTIRITNREISRVRVDSGTPGRGPGDVEIIRHNLFNKRLTPTPIGHSDYVCTFITAGTRNCSATFFLPRGRLVAGGSIRYPEFYELAVLGGTRLYDNARGTLTVIRTTNKPRRDILLFRLTG
jgi:hypothetical protein